MQYIKRVQEHMIERALKRNRSILLLGPRQTGKTTLVCRQRHQLHINLIRPDVRQRYERNPSILAGEVEGLHTDKKKSIPTIILDEVQKVPDILDVVQDLIDRKKANFILTGSSARKLKRQERTNLLPGRVLALRLEPLCLQERIPGSLEEPLLDGSLPGIITIDDMKDREMDLASYVTTYLEQEVRAEALVRNLGPFARFMEYAASDSGRLINARKLSQEIGVSHTTILSYFQILEDCLIIKRIDPLTRTQTRKRLIRTQKFLFFDLGVRRLAAREGRRLPKEVMAHLFEQLIGLELMRLCSTEPALCIRFWRDPNGPEVDWIVDTGQGYIPIEVKWTESPTENDARHLHVFLKEYVQTSQGLIVCRTPRKIQISKQVSAVPWQELPEVISKLF